MRPLTPELREQLHMELDDLSRKSLGRGDRPKRNARPGDLSRIDAIKYALDADDKRLAAEKEAMLDETPNTAELQPVPEHKVKVGDVFVTPDKNAAIVISENADSFMVSYVKHLGLADHAEWSDLKATGEWILGTTCEHHIRVGSWTFAANIEKVWASGKK